MNEEILVKRRNSLMVLSLILFFYSGWSEIFPVSGISQIAFRFLAPAAIAMLLITISQIINRPIQRSFHWLIYIFWPVLSPVYIIRFYKWKGLAIATLAIIVYLITMSAGYYLALFISQ